MSHEAMFGELRSLLQQEPSAHVWARSCGLLRRWPDPERLREQVLPYAQARLDGWPDALRVLLARDQVMPPDEAPAWLALCRDVSLSHREIRTLPEGLAQLTRLSMNVSEGTPWRALRALLESADHPLDRVHLSGRDGVDTDSLLDALEPIWARGVRELSLSEVILGEDGLWRLAERLSEARIASLSLQHIPLDSADLYDLLDAGALRACEALTLHDDHLSPESVSALATHADAPSALRTLSLSYNLEHSPDLAASSSWGELLSRHAETLQALDMSGYRLDARWYAQALDASPLRALERLNLSMTPITRETMGALASLSARAPTLRTLDLSYCMDEASDDAFEPWRMHEALPWRALDLTCCELTDAHLETLAACPALAGLEALILEGGLLTDEGISALATSAHIKRLHTLSLTSVELGDEGARQLASSPNLASLRVLVLDTAHLTDEGVAHLASSETLRLDELSIAEARAEVETWRALGAAPITAQLHSLSLAACELDAPRQEALLAGGLPERLRQLNLSGNPLGPEGARALLDAGVWPELTTLHLHSTDQTTQSIATLASAPALSDLAYILASERTIDADAMATLRAHHPILW